MSEKIIITLADGKTLEIDSGTTGQEVVRMISKSLSEVTLAMEVDGKEYDLSTELKKDSKIIFITTKDEKGLEIIRHDTAHILAQAVKELHPAAQVTIGPVIENGFYYDFAYDKPFSSDNLNAIEAKMREIVKAGNVFERKIITRDEAIKIFSAIGENYKVQIINDLPAAEEISIYYQGEFFDLCRGPHAPSMKHIKAFKLTKVSGAYWRGDSKNAMLQRVYGTAWATDTQLKDYLHMLEEAQKRDHRKLGKDMNLFHFQDDAPGVVFWHNDGWKMFQILVNFIRNEQNKMGYVEVSTPEILCRSIWETSGHWEKFKENMFTAHTLEEDKEYAIKPMSCPGAMQIYNQGIVSYRDLPIRMAEFGKVHRFEPSGALHGLMRVRGFTQDDAHIFCTENQVQEEAKKVCDFAMLIYKTCGFEDVIIKISDRPEKRIGSDEVWDKAEQALIDAVNEMGLKYDINKGEGAFYGPKIEFTLRDAIGRNWQIGTLQVDFNLPERFKSTYVGEDGAKHMPVMLHRAILGSLERFIGIILEHHAGRLPLWLTPTQIILLNISDEHRDYTLQLQSKLREANIRVVVDLDNQTLNYKIRKHSLAKVPIIGIIGSNEVQQNTVTLRRQEQQETVTIEKLIELITELSQTK